jgi:lipid II:glycine glycyltransferase (peptidoglycan interpeptide bridge formation enzyme)
MCARRLTVMVCAPPIESSNALELSMSKVGFRRLKRESWASARLDLSQDPESLRRNLDGKWRNGLRKAEKSSVRVTSTLDVHVDWPAVRSLFLELHGDKGTDVIDVGILDAIVAAPSSETWDVQLLIATQPSQSQRSEIAAAVLIVRSGSVATFLMGVATDEGRRTNATSLLLWNAIVLQHEMGTRWFDVGGLATSTPEGIARFKRGIGGSQYSSGGYFFRLDRLL